MPATARAAPCPDQRPGDFERQGYSVRKAYVTGFWRLARALDADVSFAPLEGAAFTESDVLHFRDVLRDAIKRLPMPFESPVSVTVVAPPRLVNCQSAGTRNQLDVEYPIFTTKVPTNLVLTREFAEQERSDPRRALALSAADPRLSVTPAIGYDASQRLWAGGHLVTQWLGSVVEANGRGSEKGADASATLSRTTDMDHGWLRQLIWRGGVEYADHPANEISLESLKALGQISLTTAPIGPAGMLCRFGTQFDGGRERTTSSDVPATTSALTMSRVANWKSYAGVSMRRDQQALAASYGLLVGRTGTGRLVDYRTHIVDVAHDARVPSGTRRPVEINSRFTAGTHAELGPTPIPERFFGGNVETSFVAGAEWTIRSNPVVRGIPAYRLNRSSADAAVRGIDRFAAVNFTVAVPVFVAPLLPEEAAHDQALRTSVDDLLSSGVEVLQALNEIDDPAQKELFNTRRNALENTTTAMEARVTALESSVPEALESAYETCAEKVGDLAAAASDIRSSTPWRTFINDDPEESGIPVILQHCLVDLNETLRDAELNRLGGELRTHASIIAAQLAKVDVERARRQAEETMAFPRTVIHKAFDDMTLVSLAPMVTFDAARIGDSQSRSSSRYSLGGGVRLTVASSVSFEIGYARNLKPRPGEGGGALFFATRFIDVFGK